MPLVASATKLRRGPSGCSRSDPRRTTNERRPGLTQAFLAIGTLGPGFFHVFRYDRAMERLPWMAAVGKQGMAIIGILEILGGIGLIVPAVTGILVWLTALAAASIALLMLFAIVFHLRRGESRSLRINAVLLAIVAFIAYGRLVIAPFWTSIRRSWSCRPPGEGLTAR
jgi:uncharacterized membrane protein